MNGIYFIIKEVNWIWWIWKKSRGIKICFIINNVNGKKIGKNIQNGIIDGISFVIKDINHWKWWIWKNSNELNMFHYQTVKSRKLEKIIIMA